MRVKAGLVLSRCIYHSALSTMRMDTRHPPHLNNTIINSPITLARDKPNRARKTGSTKDAVSDILLRRRLLYYYRREAKRKSSLLATSIQKLLIYGTDLLYHHRHRVRRDLKWFWFVDCRQTKDETV
jgi:hypothetical protein